ncbi:MAG: DUF5660 domain-containing protein [Patescibacteria group bacterium]|nr:DUF5660 domain-containing protein [Patescibacteria group bacterium]
MKARKDKAHSKQLLNQNLIEAGRDLGDDVAKTMFSDLALGSASDAWEQFFGSGKSEKDNKQLSGDLSEGEELNLKKTKEPKKTVRPDILPNIDYRREIIHAETLGQNEVSREITVKIQEIRVEIQKLTQTSKELQVQFKDVVVAQLPKKAGKYHLFFFEWVLSAIKIARQKVEESQSWLNTFQNKKSKRNYWAMEKKHGTSFSLSNERVVSTQTG